MRYEVGYNGKIKSIESNLITDQFFCPYRTSFENKEKVDSALNDMALNYY